MKGGVDHTSSCGVCSACVSGGVRRTSSCRARSACAVVNPWWSYRASSCRDRSSSAVVEYIVPGSSGGAFLSVSCSDRSTRMLYWTKPWLDDVQVRRFLVSRTRLRGDRLLSRGEAPRVLGCPSWKRMPSSMRRWLDDNRRRHPIARCHGRRPLFRDSGQSCEVSWTNLPNM